MMRKSVKVLLVALLAVFTFGSMAEAAQTQKVVRHRARHTSRATSRTFTDLRIIRSSSLGTITHV